MHSGWLNELGVRQLDYLTTHTSLSPIRRGLAPGFVNYKKDCIWLAFASDTVNQLLAHSRGFSPNIPASSTTKTGRHDIAEILLKVALSTKNQIICDFISFYMCYFPYDGQNGIQERTTSLSMIISSFVDIWTGYKKIRRQVCSQ